MAARQDLATPAGHRGRRRRGRLPRDRRAVLGHGGTHPQRPVPDDRRRLEDHHRVPRAGGGRSPRHLPGGRPTSAGGGVHPRARRRRRSGRVPGAAQRRGAELRPRRGAGRRHRPPAVAPAAPPRPGRPPRGRRRVRRAPGGQPAQQRADPAADHRAACLGRRPGRDRGRLGR